MFSNDYDFSGVRGLIPSDAFSSDFVPAEKRNMRLALSFGSQP
jgi:hypothetical protein